MGYLLGRVGRVGMAVKESKYKLTEGDIKDIVKSGEGGVSGMRRLGGSGG